MIAVVVCVTIVSAACCSVYVAGQLIQTGVHLSAEFQLTRYICWRICTSGTLGSSSFLGLMVGQKLCTILEGQNPKIAIAY